MKLSDRKKTLLKAIINDYIQTGEAVGSRTLSKTCGLGVSAATIRNEMSDLESMGYLTQLHTSSGRIPSEEGYRLYVDLLIEGDELSEEDKEVIKDFIDRNKDNHENLMKETSKMLSELTNYTTVAVVKNVSDNKIKHIQLVSLSDNEILLIAVSENGKITDTRIKTLKKIEQAKLNIISDSLTKKLSGKCISDLDENFISYIKYQIGEFSVIVDELLNALNNEESDDLYTLSLNGATNILNYPEFMDVIKAKEFLKVIEKKDSVTKLIKEPGIKKDNLNIVIGADSDNESIKDCSIVTATCDIDGNTLGKISFIGPTRMDYARICSIINYMSILLNKK